MRATGGLRTAAGSLRRPEGTRRSESELHDDEWGVLSLRLLRIDAAFDSHLRRIGDFLGPRPVLEGALGAKCGVQPNGGLPTPFAGQVRDRTPRQRQETVRYTPCSAAMNATSVVWQWRGIPIPRRTMQEGKIKSLSSKVRLAWPS